MSRIKLSSDISVDLDKLVESRMLVQANSGGGKSWALRRFIEQTFGKKQIIIIDPEGEFGNMRTEYDFVYIGEGGDAPAEPRSAALLARRLLETKANAIIDIYELGSKRGDFVKAFFEACVNMPKELWMDCFFILDEAHKFAPEKGQGESVALTAVIDMASLGRKRGYCLVPATQRPSKLSKDVVAECNNKLIGRASLDIDRERSAKELGFRSKEDILSLRDLAPGEFYVFGPAISNEVVKTSIGDVSVKPPKRGTGRSVKIAPPTAKVKAILAKLADLPQEAAKEASTVAELKAEIRSLKLHKCPVASGKAEVDPSITEKAIAKAVSARDAEWKPQVDVANREIKRLSGVIHSVAKIVGAEETSLVVAGPEFMKPFIVKDSKVLRDVVKDMKPGVIVQMNEDASPFELTSAEQKILDAVAFFEDIGVPEPEKAAVAAVAGFRPTSGHFKNSCGGLRSKALVEYPAGNITLTEAGRSFVVHADTIISNDDLHQRIMQRLDGAQRRILEPLLLRYPESLSSEDLAIEAGFQMTSGHFKNTRGSLKTYGLIEYPAPGIARARSILFPFG